MPSGERGAIWAPSRAAQLVDYRGLRWGNITPTNVDGLIDFGARFFFFVELKLRGAPFLLGQRLALANVRAAIVNGGKRCVVLVAEHTQHDPHEEIQAHAAEVIEILDGEVWRKPSRSVRVREAIDHYLRASWHRRAA